MKTIALLPMKAHSARVTGKNFREFAGRPLYRWILDTLISIDEIDQIIINTDARKELVASGFVESDRVLIRDRKPEICGDEVSMNRIIEDDLNKVEADCYLMTHTTSPLLSAPTMIGALSYFKEELKKGLCDSLFTVNKIQTRFYREDTTPVNHDPTNLIPTQELEPWYEENSNLYLFTKESFENTQARIGRSPVMYVSPKFESCDIDTQEEWDLTEAMAKYQLLSTQ